MKKLSVIISNRNDTAMLSVTINSCIEELRPLGLNNCEIIICDNSDEQVYKTLKSYLPIGYIRDGVLKVYRQDFPCLFSAREKAIKESVGKYIACIDSHVIIGRGMFYDLYEFMEKRSDETTAFAHAPINWSHHHQRFAKHDRDMSKHELGDWNSVYNDERTITWKGMPWICTKKLWNSIRGYGALSEHNISWGGGDMHIGIKPWMLGYKNWAVPTNATIHIGPFPKVNTKKDGDVSCNGESCGYKYRLYGKSGNYPHTFGFLVSCYILGGEPMMFRNKDILMKKFGNWIDIDKHWNSAKEVGKEEKAWLDENKKFSFEELLEKRPWNQPIQ